MSEKVERGTFCEAFSFLPYVRMRGNELFCFSSSYMYVPSSYLLFFTF